jgi:hypothetical protein
MNATLCQYVLFTMICDDTKYLHTHTYLWFPRSYHPNIKQLMSSNTLSLLIIKVHFRQLSPVVATLQAVTSFHFHIGLVL